MEHIEKAKAYAEEKALNTITSALEQAYRAGYVEGYKDAIVKNETRTETIDGVEFIDLGLPSGTNWSSTYLKNGKNSKLLSYDEAIKMNIPSIDQFKELLKYCTFTNNKSVKISAPNGKELILSNCITITIGNSFEIVTDYLFWLEGEDSEKKMAPCADGRTSLKLSEYYRYSELPVMLVIS